MRVIGIDPGLRRMGWGVVDVDGPRPIHVANGACLSEGTADLAYRLCSLHTQLVAIFARYRPEAAAVEHTFVNKDAAGTLKLGQARGIALLVPAQAGLPVAEYAPNAVKKAIVGVGHADKAQIQHMVRLQLPGVTLNGPDAADALAIALCHAHHVRFGGRLQAALAKAGDGEDGGSAMIGKITGRIDSRGPDHVLVEAGGLGYIVHCSDRTLAGLPGEGEVVALYTELLVREDLMQLFGFPTLLEREWHRLLMTVQGVGAKAALAVLGTLGPDGLMRALSMGDATAFRAAPGVGPKLAQRIVLELKAKSPGVVGTLPRAAPTPGRAAAPQAGDASADALSALTNLGYAPTEAAMAISAAAAEGAEGPAALIRNALRLLAPKA